MTDAGRDLEAKIERAAELLRQAHYVVALTGAGISTPSGIPDFRSPKSGLWEQVDPMEVATIYAFRRHPERFFRWVQPLVRLILEARPNPAHRALARLEEAGLLKAVITQNIDGLHQRAGSQTVYEVHGHIREATCLQCYVPTPTDTLLEQVLLEGKVPRCPICGGVLKPNVILFGEQLPVREMIAAQQAVRASDLMLVAGSSLEVAPAGDLPLLALEHGARLILINLGTTYLDQIAHVVIHADVAYVLPRLVALLGLERQQESV